MVIINLCFRNKEHLHVVTGFVKYLVGSEGEIRVENGCLLDSSAQKTVVLIPAAVRSSNPTKKELNRDPRLRTSTIVSSNFFIGDKNILHFCFNNLLHPNNDLA